MKERASKYYNYYSYYYWPAYILCTDTPSGNSAYNSQEVH